MSLVSILSSVLLWENHKQIEEIRSTFENRKLNVESFAEELEALFKSDLQNKFLKDKFQFFKEPYCSNFKNGNLTVLLFVDNYKAKIWILKNKDFSLYKKNKPSFNGKIVKGVGGISIHFLEDGSTYFPENIVFDEKGRLLTFFVENSKFSPCLSDK